MRPINSHSGMIERRPNQTLQIQLNAAGDQIGLTPEEVISKIMANPDVAMAFQNPRVQAAIMDCSQNPLSIGKYQNDKEVSRNITLKLFSSFLSGYGCF
ncbi:hypothetical protein RJ640_009515 [Escallonia rubra]|uniref:Protein TIC 40, chloroplastic n=1 Tax=Escallonia rubra TaxID=112253 RepID=A0AA88QTM3_9ASTE|nr:hypothetical protein RJ640_009515 [Escallonia rubra]